MSDRQVPSDDDLLALIRSGPHFRVLFEPLDGLPDRWKTPMAIRRLAEQTVVQFRGWDYPHLSTFREELCFDPTYFGCKISWDVFHELWRIYRSGQFVHLFSCHENSPEAQETLRNCTLEPPGGDRPTAYISLVGIIWTFTEVFEFLARLTQRAPFGAGARVTIELHKVAGMALGMTDLRRMLHGGYKTFSPSIFHSLDVAFDDCVTHARSNAIEFCRVFFEYFEAGFSTERLEEMQEELYHVFGKNRTPPD